MASLHKHESGLYLLAFSYNGTRYLRACGTKVKSKADALLITVEETLTDIGRGRVAVPENCSSKTLWQILKSGGHLKALPSVLANKTLGEVVADYFASYPVGAKEETTLSTERTVFGNLKRIIGEHKNLQDVGVFTIEKYIAARQKGKGNYGKTIAAKTINDEVTLFSALWKFASKRGYVAGDNPATDVRRVKGDAPLPFKTYAEIEKIIKRNRKMTDAQKQELWSCVFLDEAEILDFLAHVKKHAEPTAHPVLAFVAFTGCRRSEMMRAEISDIDIENDSINIREKKKSKSLAVTHRRVEMHPRLKPILKAWLAMHPDNSEMLFPNADGEAMSPKESYGMFERTIRDSGKWEVVEGYHTFRHSFISGCARRGIPQAFIDAWVGHTTEAMRERYRHLYQDQFRSNTYERRQLLSRR
jgi:integrase